MRLDRALCLYLLPLAGTAQVALELNKPVTARLEAGRAHSYKLELKKDDYIEVLAEQTEVDIVLSLFGPGGNQLQEVNFLGIGGGEFLIHFADLEGAYRLEVRPAERAAIGSYTLHLKAKRVATAYDREVAAADVRLRDLSSANSAESAEALEALSEDFRQLGVARRQAQALVIAGGHRGQEFQLSEAASNCEKAAWVFEELLDLAGKSLALDNLASAYQSLSQYEKAISYFEQALAIRREIKDRAGQGESLNNLGIAYRSLSQYDKAISYSEQALAIDREVKNRAAESGPLNNLGTAYYYLGQYEKAISYFEQAFAIDAEFKNRSGEGLTLNNLGIAYRSLSQYDKAISYFERALDIDREIKNRTLESGPLNNLGTTYYFLGQYEKAISYFEPALAIRRGSKDRSGEAGTLGNLGISYSSLSQYEKAISYFEAALAVMREIKNRVGEAQTLNNLGIAYRSLGQYEKAITYFEPALAIDREVKSRALEGLTLNNLGNGYLSLSQYEKAISYLEPALAIDREVKNRRGEAETLNNLGIAYRSLSQYQKAISYFEQALAIDREVKNRAGEGGTLNNLGITYRSLGQYDKAVSCFEQALAIDREVKNRAEEGEVLSNLMRTWISLKQRRIAVFYGKQAVNVIQSIRSDIRGLSQESQKVFLEDNKDAYRTLAEELVAQGRLLEAQQVLDLLKEQEFFNYVRRNERRAGPSGRADLTEEESQWAERYRASSEVLVAKGAQMEELEGRIRRQPALMDDPAIKGQRTALQKDLEAGNRAFQQYLSDLKKSFAAKSDSAGPPIDLREIEAFKTDLAELKHGAVAIYTFVTTDHYHAILVTSKVEIAYQSAIKSEELNRKILAFHEVTQDPRSDPRELALELYKILIPPALARDLQQAGAQTLMWSLDGPLRYIPIAALYDGKQYLIEKYRVAVITPASHTRLMKPPRTTWRAVGFGVTQAHEGFAALPSVTAELAGVVRENPREPGVLNGRRLLDVHFTREAMDQELMKGYPVVHVASHFSFRPGDETHSFLLLGDGSQFSLADLSTADTIFAGVDLLTLSACSTGLGDIRVSDGSEVEGFGVLAQRKGAKAVVASLWPVADVSTALLMRKFYQVRQTKPALTKLDALREAQLEMLHGKLTIASVASHQRGLVHDQVGPSAPQDFRHPYFWAPFFLMGNWL
jgi:tetratricopeptide (TPR) repeat protein